MPPADYHYTECGLDNVYLINGFDYVDAPAGRQVKIKDIDGLHIVIGRTLINQKENLTGKEIRFLRQEMLMSQATLAKLLQVSEQAIHRWEKNKTGVSKPAEMLIRLLYREHINEKVTSGLRVRLEKLADIEDSIDGSKMTLQKSAKHDWQLAAA